MRNRFYPMLPVAAAALVTLGSATILASSARDTGQQNQAPAQQGQTAASGQQTSQSGAGDAARQHLIEARQALTDLTKMPEVGKLEGQPRNDLNQLITSFNGLITAQANWYERYQEVERNLATILGTQAGAGSTAGGSTAGGSTGETGQTGSTAQTGQAAQAASRAGQEAQAAGTSGLPASVIAKLSDFKTHLDAFGVAAGAPDAMYQQLDEMSRIVQDLLGSPTGGAATGVTGATGTSGASTPAGESTVSVRRTQLEQLQQRLSQLRDLVRQRAEGMRKQ